MSKAQKKDLIVIGFSVLFFILGFALHNNYMFGVAYIIAGVEVIRDGFTGIFKKQFLDENFLMAAASIAAIYCGQYSEAVGVMLFYKVGEFFEHYAVNSSRRSISDLMDIAPETANLLKDGKEEEIFPDEIQVGDILLVKPGEKVPVDGTVIEGTSSVNTAALTGESVPENVSKGSEVISGSVNMTGLLKVRADKEYFDSTVAKVLELVEDSASNKAPIENFITVFAKYYTPVVVALALAMAIIPPLFTGDAFKPWIYIAAEFLVISCPCALVISVPLSLFAGIGSASKHGLLVKGSNYLEGVSKLETIAFDKTGTLTEGRFHISNIIPSHNTLETELLEAASYGEGSSNHPIAKAISKGTPEMNMSLVKDFTEIPGKGTSVIVHGEKIYCGNLALMESIGIDTIDRDEIPKTGSIVFVAKGKKYFGYIVVMDTIRKNSEATIKELKALGIKETVMLTGDKNSVAEKVGKSLHIDKIYSQLMPADKVKIIEKLIKNKKHQNGTVAFVGDGINDAPVLARADIGIAMGAFGSDAAVEAADVVIMADDISKLTTLFKISKKTLRLCKENIIFALLIKFAVIALAPFGIVSMWVAVFADVGVTALAILNSMRALKF